MAREAWRGEPKRCGARTRAGEPCQTWAMPNGRCRMHGGKSPGRPIVHGRRSKFGLIRSVAAIQDLAPAEGFDLLMAGPRPRITPCSRTNPMDEHGASDSLPKMDPLPGAVVRQFRTAKGKRYGPYYFRVWRVGHGERQRQRKEYVPADQVAMVRAACARHKALDDLPESVKRAARDLKRSIVAEQLGDVRKYLRR